MEGWKRVCLPGGGEGRLSERRTWKVRGEKLRGIQHLQHLQHPDS